MSDHPIRILQLVYNLQIQGGGAGVTRFAVELAHALQEYSYSVELCGLWNAITPGERQLIEQLNSAGIHTFTAAKWDPQHPYFSFQNAFEFLRNYTQQEHYQIIHSHSEFADVAALGLKFFKRTPSIVRTVHYGFQYEWRKRPLRRLLLTNFLYPICYSQEIGVSREIVNTLNQRKLATWLNKSGIIIHNAVNLGRFEQSNLDKKLLRKKYGLPEDLLIVGSVGRLTEQKAYTYFIDAAALVLEQMPQVYFILIGEGENKETLLNQITNRGIQKNFHLLGSRSQIEDFYHCMDLFVSSSLWEGLPTVIMESMAAGVPVVTTNIPGSSDLIEDQVTGWLAKPADAYDLAQKIIIALQCDEKKRATIIQAALNTVNSFSINNVTREHHILYQKLIAKSLE